MTLFSQCHFPQRQDDGPTQDPISASLGLVNDANTIRENIVDEFTCEVRLSVPVSVSSWRISTFLKPSLQIIRFNFISDILFFILNPTWMWAGPGVRLLRGRGEWLPALPRLLPGPLPWRPGGDDQVELHLPQPDHIRSGKQGLNWKKKLICHHCTAFNLRICGPDC